MSCIEKRDPEHDLSQGDVIVWPNQKDCMLKAAIVVTADCDLAKGKHWGSVSVVPLIPAAEYFDQFYLPKQLEKLEPEILKKFEDGIMGALSKSGGTAPSQQTLDQLLGLEAISEIIPISDTTKEAHTLIRKIRGFSTMESAASILDRALLLRDPKTRSLSIEKVRNFLNSPPGDCMILPNMEGLQSGIHVAFLRILREIKEDDIALKRSQADDKKGLRIGCLVPIVRYRLTQMLGQVFSDIGLPDAYETELNDQKKQFLTIAPEPKGAAQ